MIFHTSSSVLLKGPDASSFSVDEQQTDRK